jgi:chaperonin GroEL
MIKEACEKTNKLAGDGTTTTAILTHAIATEGLKYIEEGVNPFALSKALADVGQDIIHIVKEKGQPLTTKDEVEQVATISAQDEEIGKLIANIMDEVGND